MKTPRFYRSLPDGYAPVFTVDAKDKKTGLLLTIGSFVLSIALIVPVLTHFDRRAVMEAPLRFLLADGVFLVSIVAYMILHELVHGVVYKLLTHEKLTFGLTLTVAYCGVPQIYVSRAVALAALVMPFAVFTALLLPLTVVFYLTAPLAFLVAGLLFAIHIGGCIGDLFDMILLLFRFRDKRLLMRDTGPLQTFYLPVAPASSEGSSGTPTETTADAAAEAPESLEAPAKAPPDASEKQ